MVGDLLALQVQFSLPSGSYATVALRQITGTDMGKRSMKVRVSSCLLERMKRPYRNTDTGLFFVDILALFEGIYSRR